MSQRPLPEAIRGGWYALPEGMAVEDVGTESDAELLVFGLEGGFTRYSLEDGRAAREAEQGDYTFDGNFLIIRANKTTTYRVDPRTPWMWELEGKKQDKRLLRGLYDAAEQMTVPDERLEEIDRLPMRVLVKTRFEGPGDAEINPLVHAVSDADDVQVGACFAEPPAEGGTLWMAVTPFVEGIAPSTWEKIVRKSYLNVYRDNPDDVERVELRLNGLETMRRFDVE